MIVDEDRFGNDERPCGHRIDDVGDASAAARIHAGAAKLLAGDPVTAAADMRVGLGWWAEFGTRAFVTWSRTWLVEALILSGDLDAARSELAEVERLLTEGEERLAELRRAYVAGLLHRAEGDIGPAASEFRNVVRLARLANARGPERQAQAALDRLVS